MVIGPSAGRAQGEEQGEEQGEQLGQQLVVDTDVHEYFKGFRSLAPYLPPVHRQPVEEWGFSRIDTGFPYTSGSVTRTWQTRTGWRPQDDGELGSDLDVMRRNLFDELGIDIAILNNLQLPVAFMRGSHELGMAMATAYNTQLVERWLEPEPRLRGSLIVSLDNPRHAVGEIERLGNHPQVVQVCLPTSVDIQFGEPRLRPIWEAMVHHRLTLGIHHGYGTRTIFGYPRQHIEWKALAPSHAMMAQLASLTFNGVFDAFPDLKVVAMEAGFSWLPYFMSRLDQQYVSFRDQVPWVKRRPSDHLRAHVALTTQPMEPMTARQLTTLVEDCGAAEMLVFSSDYPHYDSDVMDEALPHGIAGDLRARIMGRNALRAYPKLEAPPA